MRKLGDEISERAGDRGGRGDTAGDSARGVDRPLEKPLQKLIEKIMTNQRASASEKTQGAAEKTPKKIVGNAGGGEAVIDGRDGRIRDKNTVASVNDPNPPKDKNH